MQTEVASWRVINRRRFSSEVLVGDFRIRGFLPHTVDDDHKLQEQEVDGIQKVTYKAIFTTTSLWSVPIFFTPIASSRFSLGLEAKTSMCFLHSVVAAQMQTMTLTSSMKRKRFGRECLMKQLVWACLVHPLPRRQLHQKSRLATAQVKILVWSVSAIPMMNADSSSFNVEKVRFATRSLVFVRTSKTWFHVWQLLMSGIIATTWLSGKRFVPLTRSGHFAFWCRILEFNFCRWNRLLSWSWFRQWSHAFFLPAVGDDMLSSHSPEGFYNDTLSPDGIDRTIAKVVNRDGGNPDLVSDWFDACELGRLSPASVGFIGLFIDTSGSMRLSTVLASRDQFLLDVEAANLAIAQVFNGAERWIDPFLTTLVPWSERQLNEWTLIRWNTLYRERRIDATRLIDMIVRSHAICGLSILHCCSVFFFEFVTTNGYHIASNQKASF